MDLGERFIGLLVNVRSLQAHHSEFLVFLQSLVVKSHVIVCTETWSLPVHQFYGIDGYYNESRDNGTDGVVMYIREDLSGVHKKIVKIGNIPFLSLTNII